MVQEFCVSDLAHLTTSEIIPVDLNSLMSFNAGLLSAFYGLLGNDVLEESYFQLHESLK